MSRVENFHVGASPVAHVAQAALQYQRSNGLYHGSEDYGNVVMPHAASREIADAYDRLPSFQPSAVPAYRQMGHEVRRQFEFMTGARRHGGMGLDVEVTPDDPYGNGSVDNLVGELRKDVTENGRIKVLSTHSTGGHGFFSDDENDMFRAVHDVFGHMGSGRGIDMHGEEAAFQKHARMFSPLARSALASETRGQNSALHKNGQFPEQKVAVLPTHMQSPQFASSASDVLGRLNAIRDARFENQKQGLG